MALPTSGQLTLSDINLELATGATQNLSLRSMSSDAGFSAPDNVSEFYGYSNAPTISDITVSRSFQYPYVVTDITSSSFDQTFSTDFYITSRWTYVYRDRYGYYYYLYNNYVAHSFDRTNQGTQSFTLVPYRHPYNFNATLFHAYVDTGYNPYLNANSNPVTLSSWTP